MALVQFEPVVYILYLNNFKQGGEEELVQGRSYRDNRTRGERERERERTKQENVRRPQSPAARCPVECPCILYSLSVLLTIFQSTPLNHFVVVLMQSEGDLVYSITLAC